MNYEDYKTGGHEGYYYPMVLPYKFKAVLRYSFGSKTITKNILNCIPQNQNSGMRYVDKEGNEVVLTELKVVLSIGNEPCICEIGVHRWSGSFKPQIIIKGEFWDIVTINDQDPMFFAPHIEGLGL